MRTLTKTNYLLDEVKTQVKQSFANWYVGISEWDDVWHRNQADMIVFNVYDSEATCAAYKQLVNAGMRGRKQIGKQPNFLYLYCSDGTLPKGFVF